MKRTVLTVALCGALGVVVGQAGLARAAIKVETVEYKQGGAALEGWLAWDDATKGKRPGVLVFPAFWGATEHDKQTAEKLAKMGYMAFVADMYGKGVRPTTPQEAGAESSKYMKDRALLLARAMAAFDELKKDTRVDSAKLAAIGYCFGGAPVLDLARSGAPLVDAVTFHGSLTTPTPENAKNIKGHVLALHGADDPIVGPPAVAAFEKEMTDAHVDWQLILYSNTMHAFTDPTHPNDPQRGTVYNPVTDKRSWQAMTDLFKNTL